MSAICPVCQQTAADCSCRSVPAAPLPARVRVLLPVAVAVVLALLVGVVYAVTSGEPVDTRSPEEMFLAEYKNAAGDLGHAADHDLLTWGHALCAWAVAEGVTVPEVIDGARAAGRYPEEVVERFVMTATSRLCPNLPWPTTSAAPTGPVPGATR